MSDLFDAPICDFCKKDVGHILFKGWLLCVDCYNKVSA
jgi:hypothetical protein